MKRVGFITSPLTSGHAVRGVGFYTKRLLTELKKQSQHYDIEIIEGDDECQLVHYPFFDLFQLTLPLVKKTKTVVTVHDVIPLKFPERYPPGLQGWLKLQVQKMALNYVDRVITDSYASIKSINMYLGVPHAKLKLVYLAADKVFRPISDKKKLSRVKNKYCLPDNYVLYVGDVNWNKNIPGLIKACEQVNYPLVMVGKQAAEIERMDLNHPQLVHLQNIDWGPVLRLGWVSDEDLVVIYNLAKVYCQPSFAEGFGLGVLEAMACGTAVACSHTHSLPEIAGSAASYFDPHNISQIVAALKKGKTGKEIDQAGKFSWAKTAQQTLEVYAEVI